MPRRTRDPVAQLPDGLPLVGRADVGLQVRAGSQAELLKALEALSLDVVLTRLAFTRDATSQWLLHRLDEQPVSLTELLGG